MTKLNYNLGPLYQPTRVHSMAKLSQTQLRKIRKKNQRKKNWAESVLTNAKVRVAFRVFEVLSVIAALWALNITIESIRIAGKQTQVAEEALSDQKISAAWQILAQPGKGSSGRRYALEILVNDHKENLIGIDLGCDFEPTVNVILSGECDRPALLNNIVLDGGSPSETIKEALPTRISQSNFKFASMAEMRVEGIIFDDVDFQEANLDGAVFKNVELVNSDFENAFMRNALIQNSSVSSNFTGAYLNGAVFSFAVVSDANFSETSGNVSFIDTKLGFVNFTDAILVDFKFECKQTDVDCGAISLGAIDISGAVFCAPINNSQFTIETAPRPKGHFASVKCVSGLTQRFFDAAFYSANNPPIGLHLMPDHVLVQPPCGNLDDKQKGRDSEASLLGNSILWSSCNSGDQYPFTYDRAGSWYNFALIEVLRRNMAKAINAELPHNNFRCYESVDCVRILVKDANPDGFVTSSTDHENEL